MRNILYIDVASFATTRTEVSQRALRVHKQEDEYVYFRFASHLQPASQKTFYGNYKLSYRQKYEDVKVGNYNGKFHMLKTFSFCLLLFMTTGFNFVKTISVT
jgi:hypothetical protein